MHSLLFKGKEYRAKKRFVDGTHRFATLQETYQKVQAFEKAIGLTRNANVTGLDRLGIPVTLAIRPNSLTISTSSGKGLSIEAALVSGIMEALEIYHVETTSFNPLLLSYENLIKEHVAIPIEDLPFRKHSLFHPKWPERWVFGCDLISGQEVAVPFTSVSMNYQDFRQEITELRSFASSTNGLASGNHFLEALCSAIYELIERDAVSCHEVAIEQRKFLSPRVCLESIPYPAIQEIIARFERVDVYPFLYDCTLDTNVPVFKAVLCDKQFPYLGPIAGYGAHLDPQVAILRALTEAAQGHTVLISGSRDDIFSPQLSVFKQYDMNYELQNYMSQEPTINAASYINQATATFEEDLHLLINKLQSAGFKQVIVFDMTQKEFADVSVVRVFVPGLEGYHGTMYGPGKRAKQFCDNYPGKIEKKLRSALFHQPAGRGL